MTSTEEAHRAEGTLGMRPSIQVTDVVHRYGTRELLGGVSFTVSAGESVAVTGPSGSGKTTLLSCLLGLIKPAQGEILVLGTRLPELSRSGRAAFRAKNIGMVFQHGELLQDLTAKENVALPAMLAPRPKASEESDLQTGQRDPMARAVELLEAFDVSPDTMAANLSGGEQQRTALARALINDPAIILADEPTGSLDAKMRDIAADMLFEIPRHRPCALVVVTHDPAVAARADRIVVIEK